MHNPWLSACVVPECVCVVWVSVNERVCVSVSVFLIV